MTHIRIVLLPKFFNADKLCINNLMNRVMDVAQDFTLQNGVAPSSFDGSLACEKTRPHRKLQLLCAASLAYMMSASMTETSISR